MPSPDYIGYVESPLGTIRLGASNDAIIEIHFMDIDSIEHGRLQHPLLMQAAQQLQLYFAGTLKEFDLPILQNGTTFQQTVYHQLQRIAYGKTISYMQLSKWLGNTKAIRAVGTANGSNQLAIVVPCHRVIGSDGSLTGYAGGIWRKQWLLQHENKFANGVQPLF
jgi:methylated-DNA-[protein]-cysteine S-methyltransferase